MTVSYKKSGPGGGNYYIKCQSVDGALAVDDYYTGSAKEPPGIWYAGPNADGSRTSKLGIVDGMVFGSVPGREDSERFAQLIQGYNPEGGPDLVQNAGKKDRIALHDWCLAPPKSVSVLWSQADDVTKQKIDEIQYDGSRFWLDFMSSKSYTRTGKAGAEKVPAPLRAVIFSHGSSRADDPQRHDHIVVLNICEHANGTSALETKNMFKWQGAASALAHAKIAWGMRGLEFHVKRLGNLFEIDGVPDKVMAAFSQRREAIVAAVESKLIAMGLDPDSAKAGRGIFQIATNETRDKKNQLTREQLQVIWHERGKALGFTQEQVTALMCAGPAPELTKEELLLEARMAVAELTEMVAVFREPALLTSVAVRLVGRASAEQIIEVTDEIKKELLVTTMGSKVAHVIDQAPKSVTAQYDQDSEELLFTTREVLRTEQEMMMLADRPDGKHILKKVNLSESLLPEQRAAALAATTSYQSVSIIEGGAGTGKSFSMENVARIFEENDYTVTGLSASWKAALNLKGEADLDDGRAITGWLFGVRNGLIKLNEKSVIIVDEAGQAGARQLRDILAMAKKYGAKVILLGDTKQQKSVGFGDALRCLVQKYGSSRLNIIFRQNKIADRIAVSNFFDGKAKEGLEHYFGNIKILENDSSVNLEIVDDWYKSRSSKSVGNSISFYKKDVHFEGVIERVEGETLHVRTADGELIETGSSHLIVALDKVSVVEINRLAHEVLKANGHLGHSAKFHTMDCKTADERVEFSVGDKVVFRVNNVALNVFNRVEGTIVNISNEKIHILTDDGISVEMDTNDEKWKFKEDDKFQIIKDDGKTANVNSSEKDWQVDKGGLALQHSYSTTMFSAQGLTRDYVFVRDHIGVSRASAGVSMSRHRQDVNVYVNKQARYEAKMKDVPADQWKPMAEFSNEECLARIATSWSKLREKDSTLDYTDWKDHGAHVDIMAELEIARIEQAAEQAQIEIDRIREASRFGAAAYRPMPFQLRAEFALKEIPPNPFKDRIGVNGLARQGIESDITKDAIKQGFMRFDSKGKPVFCGRREDGALVNVVTGDGPAKEELRYRFPPILRGDPSSGRVDIVETGKEALQLWNLQDKAEQPRSTVIVTSGIKDALSLPHTREILSNATRVETHEKEALAKVSQATQEASAQEAAAEAQRAREAAEEAQRAALSR